jgi:hypothetical protein
MNLSPEQLFAKIGMVVMENDILRAELGKLQKEKVQIEKELQEAKDGKKSRKKK